jgi:sugar/nucleoside kinase (ribokinase family)
LPGSILVAGNASIDTVTNVMGSRKQPGGAAVYAAFAARIFNDGVKLATAIGGDYDYRGLLKETFPAASILVAKANSTRFEIRYDEGWNANYRVASFGAARLLRADQVVKAALGCSYVHLAPMPPGKVHEILRRLKKDWPDTIVSVNTWDGYMAKRKDREILREIARDSNFFIVNEREIKKLMGISDITLAMRRLESQQLVVTLGDFGAIYVSEGQLRFIPATAGIAGDLVDTTGAGDAWCGAFLGAHSLTGSLEQSVTAASMLSALKCRDWGFQKLLGLRFQTVEELVDYAIRLRGGGQMTMRQFLGSDG